jgi:DNA helicase HerA-like ATPase
VALPVPSGARALARGAWNHAIVAIGAPGSGKSTWLVERVIALSSSAGAIVIAADPEYRIPELSPTGTRYPVARVDSRDQAIEALRADPRRVIALTSSPDATLSLALELAAASLAAHGGRAGTPVMLLVDEAVALDGAGIYRLGDELRRVLVGRRHLHVGIAITMQEATIAHRAIVALSTEVAIFRVGDPVTIGRLRARGVPQAILDSAPTLAPHRCYVHR